MKGRVEAMNQALDRLEVIFDEVAAERKRQDAQWGEQNHPSVDPGHAWYSCRDEGSAKSDCELATMMGRLTWGHIACEELAEALHAANDTDRRAELIQLAAVIVAWCECLDRNNRR